MKTIIYANTKEMIEVSYPNWLDFVMRFIWKYLKVKTVKRVSNGHKITRLMLDEYGYLPPLIVKNAIKLK